MYINFIIYSLPREKAATQNNFIYSQNITLEEKVKKNKVFQKSKNDGKIV